MTPNSEYFDSLIERLQNSSLNEIQTWLTAEGTHWVKIKDEVLKSINNLDNKALANKIDLYIELIGTSRNSDLLNESFWSDFRSLGLPTHEQLSTRDALKLVSEGTLSKVIKDYAKTNYSKSSTTSLGNREAAELGNGYIQKLEIFYNKANREIQARLDDISKHLEEANATASVTMENSIKAATQEISSLVNAATKAILSAEPVSYWEERRKAHKEQAEKYRKRVLQAVGTFLTMIVILIVLEYKDGKIFSVLGHDIKLPTSNFSLALLLVFTTGSIWLIRVLVKLMMTNLSLEIEALERSTMIKTYIALEQTNTKKTAEIEILFYSTLFKPSPNTLTDDSTSPEYIRLLEALIQKKSS